MTTRMNRLVAIALILATSNLMAGSLIFGAGRSEKQKPQTARKMELSKTETPAPLFQTQQDEKQYPPEELEQLRSKLLELVDTVKEYSDLLLPDNPELAGKLEAARKQFEQYSPQQLNTARAALNPAEMNARFGEARAALEEYRPALESVRQQRRQQSKLRQSTGVQINSAGLPDRTGPDPVCDALVGSGRVTYAVTAAADVIFLTAAGVRAGLSRGCNQVLVALGEGGNSSLACIAADVVYYAAVAVRNKLLACDVDWTERTLDANYGRLEHIHTDLENSVANDNTNTTTITGAVTTATTTITTNDNTNTASIIANANANKGDVITNANANTSTITTAITNAQTTIITNANANATMLRDLILRTQIEADLASTDGSTFVALYLTPGAKGGYLELVRSIVVQTIANIGGANTAQANAFLAKGDASKAAGDYRSAYSYYRQAYKKAQG